MVRKLTAILLVFLLLFNSIGVQVFYALQTLQAKNEMKAYLRKHVHPDEETIVLTDHIASTIKWENPDEFSFQDQMYDVIEKRHCEQGLAIRCIADKKETALIDLLQKENRQASNQKSKLGFDLLTCCFLVQAHTESIIDIKVNPAFPSHIYILPVTNPEALKKPPAVV
jgi:hypothetical protein